VTELSAGLPSPEQVIELLSAEFARAGFEIEDVAIDIGTRPPRIRLIADGDRPLNLDAVAELSRLASERLDAVDTGDTAYELEVSSPGVDRPLTSEKHFRRAHARKVEMELVDGTTLIGRLGATADGAADLLIRAGSGWKIRRVALADISKAIVQVEFSPPSAKELEHLGGTGTEDGT